MRINTASEMKEKIGSTSRLDLFAIFRGSSVPLPGFYAMVIIEELCKPMANLCDLK